MSLHIRMHERSISGYHVKRGQGRTMKAKESDTSKFLRYELLQCGQ